MAINSDKILNPKTIFWFLVALGAALRIGSLWGPLSHDELSAIVRLNFDTFSDLIDYGVREDGHPAGVQVFLWLWSRVFGTSAFAIRLPFLLMGIASVMLVYVIARRWYGEWPALLPTAMLAVTQFTVYYSVIARPYIAGLFLMLCMLYCWTRILLDKEYKLHWLALLALSAAGCAYTHYFCMLSAFLLGLAGLLFVDRHQWWRYLLACMGAVLLFLPHWGITSHQLFDLQGIGGAGGWLGKPTPSFLPEHLRYLFHYSWIVSGVAVVGYLLVFSPKDFRKNIKLISMSWLMWLLPLAIGYFYSVKVNPVLQFSSLIFVFPFFPLALAGAVDSQERKGRQALVLLIYCFAMVLSLVFTRKHFQMVQRDYIEITAQEERAAIDLYGADNVTCMVNIALAKLQYYDASLYSLPQSVLENYAVFDSVLTASSTSYLLCSGIQDPKILDIAMRHYPYLLRYRDCLVTEVLLFGREPAKEAIDMEESAIFDRQRSLSAFDGEYYDLLDTILGDLSISRFVCLDSRLLFCVPDSVQGSLHLVTETQVNGCCVDWRECTTDGFRYCQGDTCEISIPVRMETWVKHRSLLKNTRIKVYLWNPDKDHVTIPISYRVTLYPTNPFVYSVLEEI
ncbi:MAG: glycosyltransferase family 39 protein [Bacteroidales bacterium]|nr:glycosyltransferase family 39 protein [Bacteroidales bacterium]